MRCNILWSGHEYYSLENCLVDMTPTGAEITSTIVGHYEGKIYRVEYRIVTNPKWETLLVEIHSRHNDVTQSHRLERNGLGNWIFNGKPDQSLRGCIDVDIPLTPFTNTLPIRRLGLATGESKKIDVIYCDLLQEEVKSVRQKYTCVSNTRYHYQNVPNDFEATIEVDEHKLVVDYPQLFVRTKSMQMDP